jgi:hypothetical protein
MSLPSDYSYKQQILEMAVYISKKKVQDWIR